MLHLAKTGDIIITEQQQAFTLRDLPLDQNPPVVYVMSKAAGSRSSIQSNLRIVVSLLFGGDASDQDVADFPFERLEYQHVERLKALLVEQGRSSSYSNKILSVVKQVMKTARKLRLIDKEQYDLISEVEPVKQGEQIPTGRDISFTELMKLSEACKDGTQAGLRDRAILIGVLTAGLRSAEVVKLTLADYGDGTLKVLKAKGNKERLVHLNESQQKILNDWLAIRGDSEGFIFTPINKGDTIILGRGITTRALQNMLDKRLEQAKLAPEINLHDFRRTVIGDLLSAGKDIKTISNIVGHSSVETTARYDRRPEQLKRDAMEAIQIPD